MIEEDKKDEPSDKQNQRVQWLQELASWLERDTSFVSHLLQAAPDAIIVVDTDGHIILVNNQAELMTGYHRTEMIGHSVDLLVPEILRQPHSFHRNHYLNDPRPRPMAAGGPLALQTKSGQTVLVQISLSPVVTVQGIFVLTILRRVRDTDGGRKDGHQRTG